MAFLLSTTQMTSLPVAFHLDLKGMIPHEEGMLMWLDRLAKLGVKQLVLEYEDRLPWQSWPGTFRPDYDMAAWQRIWQRSEDLDIKIIPLIQVQGHLGWLLRHEPYAHLRENNAVSEACPLHPELRPRLLKWIDEVIALHPKADIIHLGADETFCLATCPKCQARAKELGGKINLYLEHLGELVDHVIHRGRQPMIWGDAFWHDNASAAQLPESLILVDWQYGFLGPTQTALGDVKQSVWMASGARSGDSLDDRYMLGPLVQRLRNIHTWQRAYNHRQTQGLMHTIWSRSSSHGALYGPLEGWWPLIEAAARPTDFEQHPLAELLPKIDAAMHPRPGEIHESNFAPDLLPFKTHADPMVQRSAAWWQLAARIKLKLHSKYHSKKLSVIAFARMKKA